MPRSLALTPLVALDDDWFYNPIQTIAIRPNGPPPMTSHDGAVPVLLPSGQAAFAKPIHRQENLIVAREKICADLGRELGLPTAPAVVRRPDTSGPFDRHVLLSLVTLAQGRLWGQGGAAYIPVLLEALEGLRVFWTWIGDADHNGHPCNLLYEVAPDGRVDLSAIDHSFALCHGNATDPLFVKACSGYGTEALTAPEVAQARVSMIEAIESLERDVIENFVHRLGDILTDDQQKRILLILEERRTGLRAMLGVQAI